jgi:hypothetical protein
VIDMLKGYLQLAGGMTQLTRQRALEIARALVAAVPANGSMPTAVNPDELAARASSLADELLTAGRQNRALLMDLVRTEVENVVGRLGLAGQADLEVALATSRARIADLEHELAQRDAELTATRATARKVTARKVTAKKATARKATPQEATATKATARKATPQEATATKATARKATPQKATPQKATAKRATAKRATAKRATAKRATAQKATAKRATAKRAARSGA